MFLAYLDSSGRPTFADKENFVLASVITNERSWQEIDNGVKAVKLKHFPNLPDSDVEIHAKDMLNHDGIFKPLSWQQIYDILDDVFAFVSEPSTELSIVGVLIDKSKLYKGKDIQTWAFRLLLERINKFVEKQNVKLLQASYPHEFCIMILDSENPVKDQALRRNLYGMMKQGTLYSKLAYLIEDPLFTDSKWRNLSQLADCVAYCIRKNYRTNVASFHTAHWKSYFKQIEKKFDSPHGTYLGYGIKIFP